jgi:hypothetical protein
MGVPDPEPPEPAALPGASQWTGHFLPARDFRFPDADAVAGLLAEAGPRVKIHKGWIPEVLAEAPECRWSLVHVDVDLYEPTAAARVVAQQTGTVTILVSQRFSTTRMRTTSSWFTLRASPSRAAMQS